MPSNTVYSFIAVIIVSLISLIGIFTISVKQDKLKKILIYLVSFSAGAILGDVFIHLLPGIVRENGFTPFISIFIISGIAFSFIVEKIIHWRHCHMPLSENHAHPFAIVNLFGDSIHNLIDGIIIGSSFLVNLPVGIATSIAVLFHEIPQEIGDFAVLLHGGFSKARALFYNFLTGITAILGLIISLVAQKYIAGITLFLIPFSAGSLIYVAGSDLIPELHKETKARKSLWQFALFIAGVFVMMVLLLFENP